MSYVISKKDYTEGFKAGFGLAMEHISLYQSTEYDIAEEAGFKNADSLSINLRALCFALSKTKQERRDVDDIDYHITMLKREHEVISEFIECAKDTPADSTSEKVLNTLSKIFGILLYILSVYIALHDKLSNALPGFVTGGFFYGMGVTFKKLNKNIKKDSIEVAQSLLEENEYLLNGLIQAKHQGFNTISELD